MWLPKNRALDELVAVWLLTADEDVASSFDDVLMYFRRQATELEVVGKIGALVDKVGLGRLRDT